MSSGYEFTTNYELRTAVDLWCSEEVPPPSVITTYGDINTWDVSIISDFSSLFEGFTTFNSDISNWDVGSGTDFSVMFYN